MTIAELHGKISHTGANLHDQMEDLLTSDVFSVCKYVRPATLLLPFLRTAIDLYGTSVGNALSEHVSEVDYCFWPLLQHSEPDLLLCLHVGNGKHILVMVEAKYYSPKSGRLLEMEDLEVAQGPSDQLAREYLDLLDAHQHFGLQNQDIQYRCLIYLTAHRFIPIKSLQESMSEILHHVSASAVNLLWTSWFKLHPLLREETYWLPWEKPILQDLCLLMERKAMIAFSGFRSLQNLKSITETPVYVRGGYFTAIRRISPISRFYTRRAI